MRLVCFFPLSLNFARNDVRSCGGVSWISVYEDAPTFGWADGEAANAVLFVQKFELPLLLSPLGTIFALVACVRLGEKLFNRNDLHRLHRSGDIQCLGCFASTAFLPATGLDGSHLTVNRSFANIAASAW